MAENQTAPEAKQQISASAVQQMLKEGKTRDEIGKHFGLNGAQTKRLFSHEKLKGLKTHVSKQAPFQIIDDAPERPAPAPKAPGEKKTKVKKAATPTAPADGSEQVAAANASTDQAAEAAKAQAPTAAQGEW